MADSRYNPFTGAIAWSAISAESHTIALQVNGLYGFRLNEKPYAHRTGGNVFTITSTGGGTLTEIPTGTPAAGQCRVDYGTADFGSTAFVWCNSSDNGRTIACSYDGGGGMASEDAILAAAQAGGIADGAVTNAKLADMAQATIKGRASGAGIGVPVDLTPAQARAILLGTISYMERRNGATKGATNTNVVIYGTAVASSGSDITYVNSAANGDSFTINTSGVYTIAVNFEDTSAGYLHELRIGATVDNVNNSPDAIGKVHKIGTGNNPYRDAITWTGYIAATNKIWISNGGTPTGQYTNAISIVGPHL